MASRRRGSHQATALLVGIELDRLVEGINIIGSTPFLCVLELLESVFDGPFPSTEETSRSNDQHWGFQMNMTAQGVKSQLSSAHIQQRGIVVRRRRPASEKPPLLKNALQPVQAIRLGGIQMPQMTLRVPLLARCRRRRLDAGGWSGSAGSGGGGSESCRHDDLWLRTKSDTGR